MNMQSWPMSQAVELDEQLTECEISNLLLIPEVKNVHTGEGLTLIIVESAGLSLFDSMSGNRAEFLVRRRLQSMEEGRQAWKSWHHRI